MISIFKFAATLHQQYHEDKVSIKRGVSALLFVKTLLYRFFLISSKGSTLQLFYTTLTYFNYDHHEKYHNYWSYLTVNIESCKYFRHSNYCKYHTQYEQYISLTTDKVQTVTITTIVIFSCCNDCYYFNDITRLHITTSTITIRILDIVSSRKLNYRMHFTYSKQL